MAFKVHFIREGITENAAHGELAADVMRRAGIELDEPCGGRGKCGKCAVLLNGERVLACQARIEADVEIETYPPANENAQILTDSAFSDAAGRELRPVVVQKKIHMEKCPLGKSISDWERLVNAVYAACDEDAVYTACNGAAAYAGYEKDAAHPGKSVRGLTGRNKESVPVNLRLASKAGPLATEHGGQLWAVLCAGEILEISGEQQDVYMAAFDIGTTTVAGFLLDAADGRVCAEASCLNPQVKYGGDVISRANETLEHGGEAMAECIRQAVDDLIGEMAEESLVDRKQIYAVSIAGNTCMHHLFLNINVDSLVHAPYAPTVSQKLILPAAQVGLHIHQDGKLFMLPNIAGFVGADTVACLIATDLAEQKDWTLLIDIGTNGEMVLGKDHRMVACSTAAGPAFEGAGISCGMRGAQGAISKVAWNGEEQRWDYETVGNTPPRGICGSGLLDLAAQLLESGQMDETGALEDDDQVVVAPGSDSADGKDVTLLQKDIRQLQLAKSAIASGVHLLARKMEIEVDEIRQVWLAGAFGSFMSPESACRIGLIPQELEGKVRAIGNAAGEGAKLALRDRGCWEKAGALAKEADFLELATMREFQDMFVDELLFPE